MTKSAKRRRTPMGALRDFANKVRRDIKIREGKVVATTAIFQDLKRLSAEDVRELKDAYKECRPRFYALYYELCR